MYQKSKGWKEKYILKFVEVKETYIYSTFKFKL